jgi:predicted ATPase
MPIASIKFKGYRCFATEWVGFDEYKPINVIIGRNNVGKSQLLDLVHICCKGWKADIAPSAEYRLTGELNAAELMQQFHQNTSGGDLDGSHWSDHGEHFVDVPFSWERSQAGQIREINIIHPKASTPWLQLSNGRTRRIANALGNLPTTFQGRIFRRLYADRDIQTEEASVELSLAPNGVGATNIIRRHITASSMPRERVQGIMLNALNEIFAQDGQFTEVQARQHDNSNPSNDVWEIYLGQKDKGLIPLSSSGSGLKTVILVLLHLLVIPGIEGQGPEHSVYAFEELENNLHPALLRRLLDYIERFAVANNTQVFLTTHSNVALDMFGVSNNAQIVHITHDGTTARTTTIKAHFDRLGVISELGAKPSDLLQANGIIWVEGPSDAIYLNQWIKLYTNGRFREGRDYQCAFYGGALIARTQFVGPEDAENELVNLLRINPNIIVVCDGDRTSPNSNLKPRVKRIRDELEVVPGATLWITQPKEIEGYLPGALISQAYGSKTVARDPGRYEQIFAKESKDGESYFEQVLGRTSVDKIELAASCVAATDLQAMTSRFDWDERMTAVVEAIARWNS